VDCVRKGGGPTRACSSHTSRLDRRPLIAVDVEGRNSHRSVRTSCGRPTGLRPGRAGVVPPIAVETELSHKHYKNESSGIGFSGHLRGSAKMTKSAGLDSVRDVVASTV
jgi:hypothetical protein